MDFKFRAVDGRPRTSSSSSSFNHMRGQAFWLRPNFNRPDPVQWEIEKAQIREEMIASEIARRRALEAEVRRELMLERQLAAMQTATETGLSFEQRLSMRLDPRRTFMHHIDNNRCWRPDEHVHFLSPPPLPPQMLSPPPMLPPAVIGCLDAEVKATPVGNKDKLIILVTLSRVGWQICNGALPSSIKIFHVLFIYAILLTAMLASLSHMAVRGVSKPDRTSVVGAKRKTPPLAAAGDLSLPLFNLKNKPKDEWSCAICKVSVTSEKGLTEHLQGRKHNARQARLRADARERNSNSNTTSSPKRPIKLAKVAEIPVTTSLGFEDRGKLKSDEEPVLHKKKKTEKFRKKMKNNSLQKTHGSTAADKVEGTPELTKKKKFEFWCEICKVAAYSKVVMETHNKGRRHIARLQQLEENNAAAPATTTDIVTELTSPEGTQMPKDTDVVTNEADEKLMDVQEADSCSLSQVVN